MLAGGAVGVGTTASSNAPMSQWVPWGLDTSRWSWGDTPALTMLPTVSSLGADR